MEREKELSFQDSVRGVVIVKDCYRIDKQSERSFQAQSSAVVWGDFDFECLAVWWLETLFILILSS